MNLTSATFYFKDKKGNSYTVEYEQVDHNSVNIAILRHDRTLAKYSGQHIGDKYDAEALLNGALRPHKQKF